MLDQCRWRVRLLHADCVRLARSDGRMASPARTRWCRRGPERSLTDADTGRAAPDCNRAIELPTTALCERRREVMPPAPAGGSATQEPLRGEIYSLQHLVEHARNLGAEHAAASRAVPAAPLLEEFRRARHDLEAAYEQIESAVRARGDAVPAEEWLLDNVHVVRDQLREITEDLPQGYLVKLPRLGESPWIGYPRVYVLALDFITHTDSRLDPENLLHYILSYQEHAPLTIGELWAIPIMLRLCLVDNLRRLAQQEVTARSERALADQWADRLVARARDRSAQGVGGPG